MKYRNYSADCYENLRQMLRESARRFGEKTLFLQKAEGGYSSISYQAFYADVCSLGTALLESGLTGKRIALMGQNCYLWALSYMAVVCSGGTVIPLDEEMNTKDVTGINTLCEINAIICADSMLEKFSVLGESVPRIPFSDLEMWIFRGNRRIQEGDRSYFDVKVDNRDVCAILFSNRGAEDLRGVMLSHRNLCSNVSEISQMVYVGEKDVFLSTLPLYHVYECTCGFLCPMSRGCTIVFSEGLKFLGKEMKEVSPTVMISVPSMLDKMYERLWRHLEDRGAADQVRRMIAMTNSILSQKAALVAKKKAFSAIHNSFGGRLRLLISGGTLFDKNTAKGFRDLGISVLQGYGITECSPVIALNRDTYFKDGSVGLCTPNALLDIAEMQEDGVGEIRYRGESVMVGYYRMPEQTREVIRDGWFYTGDMGYLDGDGFLYVTGQKKNAIDVGDGKKIFPEELEAAICRSSYVKECVVVGYPDEKRNTTHVVALIYPDLDALAQMYGTSVSKEQMENALQRVLAEVNGLLPSYKNIETFLIRDRAFPKTPMQRIRRAGLAEMHFGAFRDRILQNSKNY